MCGIVGIANINQAQPTSEDLLLRMLAAIEHRGPDGFGIYQHDDLGLGSARLSIIDLSSGDQPIANEDRSLWIVFNGEIFNYIELRRELELKGHQFYTQSDTEVLLHLYEEKGADCVRLLNGQFVFAIWDEKTRSLFLARDRVGVRPLFYTVAADQFIFASEIKAIRQHPAVHLEIDPRSLQEVFTYWSPQPPKTIFKQIFELPPGHRLFLSRGQIQIDAYWQPEFRPDPRPRPVEEYIQELEELLIDATRIRLRADVPVGAYLSGGLDSSLTTALIQAHTANRLDTFSITFSDPEYDESRQQAQMVKALGTNHHVVHCSDPRIGEIIPEVVWHAETPLLRTAPAPMYLLSKLVREQRFKVVMTGEGADEFFAGYNIFKEMKIRRFWAANPGSTVRPLLFAKIHPNRTAGAFLSSFYKRGFLDTAEPYYSHLIRWNNTARTRRFLNLPALPPEIQPEFSLPAGFSTWDPLSQAQYLEITTFLSPYLLSSQGDRMAMAHSVEGRYPFLDYRVMEFCGHLPAEYKMPGLVEKWILKRVAQRYLPEAIWRRPKQAYRAPIQRCFFGEKQPAYVAELLSPAAVEKNGIFDAKAVELLRLKAQSSAVLSEVEDMALMGILTTLLLDLLFIRRPTPPDVSAGKLLHKNINRKSVQAQTSR